MHFERPDPVNLREISRGLQEPGRFAGWSHYKVSQADYLIPDLDLIAMNDETVALAGALNHDQPVILRFIYASCTSTCPVLTATLAQAERQFTNEPVIPRMVSVSIDPEYDTPERMRQYASSYKVSGTCRPLQWKSPSALVAGSGSNIKFRWKPGLIIGVTFSVNYALVNQRAAGYLPRCRSPCFPKSTS